jgi:putative ABC transport system substrate-binding protein
MLHAVKKAADTIPIVFVTSDDPVRAGLVTSFSRPAGNMTGFTSLNTELDGKRLALIKQAMPRLTSAAVLLDSVDPATATMWRMMETTARSLRVQLQRLGIHSPDEFIRAIEIAIKDG